MTFPGWHEEVDEDGSKRDVKPWPSHAVLTAAVTLSIFASVLALVSMLWQHIASVTFVTSMEDATYGTVKGEVGLVGLVLGWIAMAVMAIGASGLFVEHLFFSLLERLVDDD